MFVGAVTVWIIYKLHYWVERRFKLDDAVGAVAVHGYAGFIGLVIAGFLLWGQPSSPYEGFAQITPWGNFVGALIMFGFLGFLPGYVMSLILNAMGLLRIPRKVELEGLDFEGEEAYRAALNEVRAAELAMVKS
jgi:ammonia channel protein AmtB